jgi:hypothetical protein
MTTLKSTSKPEKKLSEFHKPAPPGHQTENYLSLHAQISSPSRELLSAKQGIATEKTGTD